MSLDIYFWRWQWCWWHRYVDDLMMLTDLKCWLYFQFFVCWRLFSLRCNFLNVLDRSSNIRHQQRCNHFFIEVTESLCWWQLWDLDSDRYCYQHLRTVTIKNKPHIFWRFIVMMRCCCQTRLTVTLRTGSIQPIDRILEF